MRCMDAAGGRQAVPLGGCSVSESSLEGGRKWECVCGRIEGAVAARAAGAQTRLRGGRWRAAVTVAR